MATNSQLLCSNAVNCLMIRQVLSETIWIKPCRHGQIQDLLNGAAAHCPSEQGDHGGETWLELSAWYGTAGRQAGSRCKTG